MANRTSHKAAQFNESVIRQMSQMARKYQAINLAQGFPDFPCPEELKVAACEAIHDDINQYAVTWGDAQFRQAIAEKEGPYLGIAINPETEVTVTCGATEAMAAVMLATINPGDEVIVFEPYYENYGPDAIIAGAVPRYVTLHPPEWRIDEAELAAAFNEKTRAIIINTPHNPTGKVFSRAELEMIARYCQKWNVLAFTDEIYEHILYDGHQHVGMASLPGMKDLTVTINGLSKTYSVTGWRVGIVIAPEDITNAVRKMHDFLTVGAAAPLQRAGITAMQLPQSYYLDLAQKYNEKRLIMMNILDEAGIKFFRSQGAYYVFSDISDFGYKTDVEFTHFLMKDIGVAVVPGSSFFSRPELGRKFVRFCFAKRPETLQAAQIRLQKLKDTVRLGR
ncbi:pyridoxal phosphate-dependent aminotransferase [Vampirovibrio chlorellavorus]|uniref:pyridoxal phosphate-dependent aminotransferase n=1 Tax=Vampirovibrio chlorellavorus TaxID=758823 RepID=UPI0026F3502D|nr:aminotransferase class I/II-fold pyridoxal phosphate-dependent enzyme [Vampirovibrio chlorellavorus]